MERKDYYKILGIERNSNIYDIKRAYRKLAIKYHPDRNQGNKEYEEKFKEVKQAYEILSNSEKRSMYDKYGHSAFNNSNDESGFTAEFSTSGDFGDIFGDVFGDFFGTNKSRSNLNKKGSDIKYDLYIELEDIIKGSTKNIEVNILQKCSLCRGTGCRSGYNKNICNLCKGTGDIINKQGFFTVQQTCPNCKGNCYIISNPCYICHGEGIEKSVKNISIKIPIGIDTNDTIRLVGKGNCGKFGLNPGDLYINIKIKKHNIFTRKGNDLYCNIPVNCSMAALGGTIKINTLSGNIKIKIPYETQTGKLLRIKYRGLKDLKRNIWGDLICRVYVVTPINLNEFQKKLLYDLGKSLKNYNYIKNNTNSKSFFEKIKKFFQNFN